MKTGEALLSKFSDAQREQFSAFEAHLRHFNRRLNLVSRSDEKAFFERHVLHSLALAHRCFPAGSRVVDWGTGGGLPAIPLAIAFPDVEVYAVDAIGKKIQAVRAMGRRLGLVNLHAWQGRAEEWPGRAHFSVSRATAPLADLWRWHTRSQQALDVADEACWPPGLICLKGGDLTQEIAELRAVASAVLVEMSPLGEMFGGGDFAEKFIVQVVEFRG